MSDASVTVIEMSITCVPKTIYNLTIAIAKTYQLNITKFPLTDNGIAHEMTVPSHNAHYFLGRYTNDSLKNSTRK